MRQPNGIGGYNSEKHSTLTPKPEQASDERDTETFGHRICYFQTAEIKSTKIKNTVANWASLRPWYL